MEVPVFILRINFSMVIIPSTTLDFMNRHTYDIYNTKENIFYKLMIEKRFYRRILFLEVQEKKDKGPLKKVKIRLKCTKPPKIR